MHNYSTAVEKKKKKKACHTTQFTDQVFGNVKPEWQAAVTTGLQGALLRTYTVVAPIQHAFNEDHMSLIKSNLNLKHIP